MVECYVFRSINGQKHVAIAISKNWYAVKPQLTVSSGGIKRRGESGFCLFTLYMLSTIYMGKEMANVSRGSR